MRILRTDSHFRPTAKSGRATASKLLRQTKNEDGIKYTISLLSRKSGQVGL